MSRLTILLSTLALLAGAGAPAALAQDNPFGPIPPAPPEQPAPAEEEDDDNASPFGEDEGITERQQLLIILGGGILVVGIAWFILRDARRSAPAETRQSVEEGGTTSRGTRKPQQQRVSQGRAKAKAARQARKRNKRRR
jgi:hypothetical protein